MRVPEGPHGVLPYNPPFPQSLSPHIPPIPAAHPQPIGSSRPHPCSRSADWLLDLPSTPVAKRRRHIEAAMAAAVSELELVLVLRLRNLDLVLRDFNLI